MRPMPEESTPRELCVVLGPFLPPPPGPAGAVERRWVGTAERWACRGDRVTVVCRRPDAGDPGPLGVAGIRFVPIAPEHRAGSTWRDLLRDLRYSMRAKRRLPASGVVVTNTFFLPILLRGWARRSDRLVCVNVARFPKGRSHLRLLAKADRLIAVSSAIREAIAEQHPALLERTRIVPNPIETDVFRMTELPRGPGGGATLLYTGRVHPEKGLGLLVDAAAALGARFPGIRIRCLGESTLGKGGGGEAYVSALRGRAADAGVELHMLPAIYDREALAAELRGCDVYVYPSVAERGESFGVAPLEAMGVGCPVVVSKLSCFREFLEDRVNGLVFDHRDAAPVERLAEALSLLLGDPALARRLGDAAALTATGFSYEAIASRYLEVFDEAISTKQR